MSDPTVNDPGAVRPMGHVCLVGAGPGSADLITVRGARRLAEADLVLYDALASEEMRVLAPHARWFFVGKRACRQSIEQDVLNRLLIKYARRGLRVVRLKCGDPFVFGRGGEEALALAARRRAVRGRPRRVDGGRGAGAGGHSGHPPRARLQLRRRDRPPRGDLRAAARRARPRQRDAGRVDGARPARAASPRGWSRAAGRPRRRRPSSSARRPRRAGAGSGRSASSAPPRSRPPPAARRHARHRRGRRPGGRDRVASFDYARSGNATVEEIEL